MDADVQIENSRGQWVPAIPLPWFLGFFRVRCSCGESFWSGRRYRGHYALVHVLGLE